jgi:hypothetical protein
MFFKHVVCMRERIQIVYYRNVEFIKSTKYGDLVPGLHD